MGNDRVVRGIMAGSKDDDEDLKNDGLDWKLKMLLCSVDALITGVKV